MRPSFIVGPLLGLLVGLLAFGGSALADAEKKPEPKKGISAILKTLDWGASSPAVFTQLEAEVEARYEKKLDKVDVLVVDKIMKEQRAEKAAIRKGLVRFAGANTGYEASLIADDFTTNNGESAVRVDDGPAQRYYFFKDEQLYKVLVVYSTNVARQTKFPDFVRKAAGKYGQPAETRKDKEGKALVSAIWRDGMTELRVEDRSLFGTYTMAFIQLGRGVEIEAERTPTADGAQPIVSAQSEGMIADIMGDGEGAGADVVDRLTGTEHKVDLELGREEYQPLRRAPDPAPAGARAGKKASPDARKAAKKAPRKSGDVDLVPDPSGSDDIVY